MKKIVGIIGGMGPMATVDLFKKIVDHTPANSDQDHVRVVIDNNTDIADRSSYILNGGINPATEILSSARNLISIGAKVLIMPCNTAHYFYDEVCSSIDNIGTDIKFLHMIEETANHICNLPTDKRKVYLLATQGTYSSKIYDTVFEAKGVELVKPTPEIKSRVMDMIYDYKKGTFNYTSSDLNEVLNDALSKGASSIILGCTELPLIFDKLNIKENTIDPTEILAKKAIELSI